MLLYIFFILTFYYCFFINVFVQNVSQKSNSQLLKIEQVMSHTGNYSHYRALTRECVQKGLPCVPLLCMSSLYFHFILLLFLISNINLFDAGLLLQDLTFINDGNDNETTDGRVNFDKWNMFGSCMLGFSKLMVSLSCLYLSLLFALFIVPIFVFFSF